MRTAETWMGIFYERFRSFCFLEVFSVYTLTPINIPWTETIRNNEIQFTSIKFQLSLFPQLFHYNTTIKGKYNNHKE